MTTVKSSNLKGFPRFTATDEQRISATPKEGAGGSNPFWRATKAEKINDFLRFLSFLLSCCIFTKYAQNAAYLLIGFEH